MVVIALICGCANTRGGLAGAYLSLYPSAFRPVELSAREQSTLDGKLDRLGIGGAYGTSGAGQDAALEAEPYREDDARRVVSLTEKELNGLLAKNTDLASRFAIDLSEDLASARLLLPMDNDFPILGGRTIRIDAGLELAFENGQPIVALRGVSVMGVPIPNAWLGNLKNVDLVQQFGADRGFWRAFGEGVESLQISSGEVQVRLKE